MARPDDLLDRFRVDPARGSPAATEMLELRRPEPALAAGAADGEPVAPRLDPQRAAATPEARAPASRQRGAVLGVVGSIALHLLPLILLIDLTPAPAALPAAIPVQLIVEPPPAPKPEAPKPEARKPPPGRLASDDMGDPAPPDKPPAAAPPASPSEAEKLVAAMPPPPPLPDAPALPAEPLPTPAAKPPPKHVVVARLAPNREPAPRHARFPGPAATRNEYLAYCAALIRRYFDMLPPAFLAGRSGVAVLTIVVLDDGTIARVAVLHSSGYRDIDSRAEQMVATVRRFPPLPQWTQDPSMMLEFNLPFHDGLIRQ